MSLSGKNLVDFYQRLNSEYHSLQSGHANDNIPRTCTNGGESVRQNVNLHPLFADDFHGYESFQKFMQKFCAFTPEQVFLFEMKRRFPLAFVNEKITNNDLDVMQKAYKNYFSDACENRQDLRKFQMSKSIMSDRPRNFQPFETYKLPNARAEVGQMRDVSFKDAAANSSPEFNPSYHGLKMPDCRLNLARDSFYEKFVSLYNSLGSSYLIDKFASANVKDQLREDIMNKWSSQRMEEFFQEAIKKAPRTKNILTENGKRKYMADRCEVIDLTVDRSDMTKGNSERCSDNNSSGNTDVSSKEMGTPDAKSEMRYFAVYEDFEVEFEKVDKDSILAAHQRYYKTRREFKRLKTTEKNLPENFDKEKQLYDQFEVNSAMPAHMNNSNDGIEFIDSDIDGQESETEESGMKIKPNVFEGETNEQDVAIDYSLKPSARSQLGKDLQRESTEVDWTVNVNTEPVRSNLTYDSQLSTYLEKNTNSSPMSSCDTQTVAFACPHNGKVQNRSNKSINKSLIEYVLGKTYTAPGENKKGLVNSVARFGCCLLMSKNTGEFAENKSPEKCRRCSHSEDLLAENEMSHRQVSDCKANKIQAVKEAFVIKEKNRPKTGKKTLGEIFDSMITDIMDNDD